MYVEYTVLAHINLGTHNETRCRSDDGREKNGPANDETGTTLGHLSPFIYGRFQDRQDHAPNLRQPFQEPSKPTPPSGQPLLGRE